jgi:hypothetical protein
MSTDITARQSGPDDTLAELPEVVSKCVSDLFSSISFKVATEIRSAEEGHAEALRQALEAVRDGVRRELTDAIRLEFDERFRQEVELAKEQFIRKFDEKAGELLTERSDSRAELLEFRKRMGQVAAELTGKEAELAHLDRETASMIEDPDVEISKIIRNNTTLTEIKCYIRGLQFQMGKKSD